MIHLRKGRMEKSAVFGGKNYNIITQRDPETCLFMYEIKGLTPSGYIYKSHEQARGAAYMHIISKIK